MGLLDLHAASIDEGIQRQLRSPAPPPDESFSTWGMLGAGAKGPVSAGFETAGTFADILSAYGTANEASGAGVPMFSLPTPAQRKAQDEASTRLLKGEAFDNTAGNILRRKANAFAPAETAHTADKVVHGLTRFATKAMVDVATMGPVAGGAALALDEGNTTTQNLREKGIDTLTAAKVGAVTGVLSGVGAVLPVAGTTLAKTAALVAVGGPGSFMAQESISREILQRANYPDEAATHDPTDPLGIALSVLVPGAFGAIKLRSIKRAEKMANLSKESDMKKAAAFTPEEQARGDAYERSPANLAELEKAIKSEKNPETVALLKKELAVQTDLARKFGSEPVPHPMDVAANDPEVVAAARVNVTNEALAKNLPDHPMARAEVMRAADMVAAGERVDVLELPESIPTLDAFMVERGLAAPEAVDAVTVKGNPFVAFIKSQGGISFDEKFDIVGERGILGNYAGMFTKKGQPLDTFVESAVQEGYLTRAQVDSASDTGGTRALSELIRRATNGEKIQRVEDSNVKKADDYASRQDDAAYAFMEKQLQDLGVDTAPARGNIDALADYLMEHKTALVNRKLSELNAESRDAAYSESHETPPEFGIKPESVKATPEPTIDRAALDRLTEETPDMPVRLPGSDKTVTLKEALESAKAEAEFEANEASLYKAALDCALSF